jgi:multidrug efflux pump subunit AcrA (membrane-fusion protein)
MRVEVDVPNPALDLVPGMYADATLVLDAATDAVIAPVQALDRGEDSARVMVVTGDGRSEGKIQERTVTVGLEANDRVEVTRGLSAGDFVVVGSRAQLKPGMAVMPKLAADAGAER